MIRVTEHSERRLVLRDHRLGFRLLAAAFTVLSLFSVTFLAYNGYLSLIINADEPNLGRIVVLMSFLVVGVAFVGMGVFALLNLSRDVIVTFDRDSETVSIYGPRLLKPLTFTHSIYAVLQMRIEENEQIHAYGLFLVLRSGEQIPLTTVPSFAKDELENLLNHVRGFMRGQ